MWGFGLIWGSKLENGSFWQLFYFHVFLTDTYRHELSWAVENVVVFPTFITSLARFLSSVWKKITSCSYSITTCASFNFFLSKSHLSGANELPKHHARFFGYPKWSTFCFRDSCDFKTSFFYPKTVQSERKVTVYRAIFFGFKLETLAELFFFTKVKKSIRKDLSVFVCARRRLQLRRCESFHPHRILFVMNWKSPHWWDSQKYCFRSFSAQPRVHFWTPKIDHFLWYLLPIWRTFSKTKEGGVVPFGPQRSRSWYLGALRAGALRAPIRALNFIMRYGAVLERF